MQLPFSSQIPPRNGSRFFYISDHTMWYVWALPLHSEQGTRLVFHPVPVQFESQMFRSRCKMSISFTLVFIDPTDFHKLDPLYLFPAAQQTFEKPVLNEREMICALDVWSHVSLGFFFFACLPDILAQVTWHFSSQSHQVDIAVVV